MERERDRERKTGVREKERENHREAEGYEKMRQGWEKDIKRGMVVERRIGREREPQRGRRRDRGETKIARET